MDPISAFLVNLIVGVVLSAASALISQALAPAQKQLARGFRGSVQTGGTVPQSFLVGTIGGPGKLEYRNTWGNSGETPNAYLTDVISFGDLPIAGMHSSFELLPRSAGQARIAMYSGVLALFRSPS